MGKTRRSAISFVLLSGLLLCVSCAPVPEEVVVVKATAASQEVHWVPIAGGEDLLRDPSWACVGAVQVLDGALAIEAGDGYVTPINTSGPRLQIRGDFGIAAAVEVATVEEAAEDTAAIAVFGALPQGMWWEGVKRLDFGIGSSQVSVHFWDGTSPEPALSGHFPAEGLSGQVQLELRRVGNAFVLRANGTEVGELEDPGAFPDGQVYLGANVAPGNTLTIHRLAVETEPGQGANVQIVRAAHLTAPVPVGPPLRDLAQGRGIRLGAAVAPEPLRCEPAYAQVLGREFNILTTENALKFGPVHPQRERYDFYDADQIVEFAQAHDMLVRGHTLVWHHQLPKWLEEEEWTRDELVEVLRDHIATVVGRYRGRVAAWDVVNEAVADSGSLRDTIWLRVIGPEYIEMAFRWAHEADPDALLFYNDYSGEGMGRKSDAIYELVGNLLDRAVPVHGVGLQTHVALGRSPRPQDVLENVWRLGELGLEVHITEMDVRMRGDPTEEKLARQADVYRDMMKVCLSAQNCTALVLWGFTDRRSWVPSEFSGWGSALLFDELYRPKPAYDALRDALVGR